MIKDKKLVVSNAMLRLLRKEYWSELRDFAVQSPPRFKIFCMLFIFIANIAGTTPFPQEIFEGFYFLKIWSWSLLANFVFMFTMTLCFFMPLKIAVNTESKIKYFLSPLLASLLVPIGFLISWFVVCIGTEFDSGSNGYPLWAVDWSFIDFLLPISSGANMENVGYFFWSFNGLWAPMLGLSLMVFSSVPVPNGDLAADDRGWPVSKVERKQMRGFFAFVAFLLIFVYFEWYRLFK